MPVLQIYENEIKREPLLIYSGATWTYSSEQKKLTVWFLGVQFDYSCEHLQSNVNGTVFHAYISYKEMEKGE
jgi:hypothetical protein